MASSARIEELRKKFEENPRRYFAPLANEYRKAGDIEQAIAICREYLPQQPGHMSGHIVYGQALYEARQVEEAKTVFETALSLDPENLIALRHLGDIALMVGDSNAARMWYGRVLEADPRNEEIQAQLASIDQVASSAPTPISSAVIPEDPTPAPSASPTKATPSSAPTVVVSAQRPQPSAHETSRATPVASDSSKAPTLEVPTSLSKQETLEVKTDSLPKSPPPKPADLAVTQPIDAGATQPIDMALGFEPTSMTSGAAATPTSEVEKLSATAAEAPPIDSFSLDGLETTSIAAPPPPPPPEEERGTPPTPPPAQAAAAAQNESAAAEPALVDLDFGTPVPAEETEAAIAEASPAADLPLLDIDGPSAPAADVPPVEATAQSPEPTSAPSQELPFVETTVAEPLLDEFTPTAPTPQPAEVAPEPPESGPFVTETMAELYLKQGHHEEALKVYRALLEQRPGDPSLAAKVAALTPEPALQPRSGPTIREVLGVIASKRPGAPTQPTTNGATPSAPETAAAEPASQDALSALFGGAQAAPMDERAATALAAAFSGLNGIESGAAAIGGAPAHHATNDLSLDAVFKSEKPTSPSNFSFDQFFSQRATAEYSAHAGKPAAAPEESRDDVAQFTQWLEGLKQR